MTISEQLAKANPTVDSPAYRYVHGDITAAEYNQILAKATQESYAKHQSRKADERREKQLHLAHDISLLVSGAIFGILGYAIVVAFVS